MLRLLRLLCPDIAERNMMSGHKRHPGQIINSQLLVILIFQHQIITFYTAVQMQCQQQTGQYYNAETGQYFCQYIHGFSH